MKFRSFKGFLPRLSFFPIVVTFSSIIVSRSWATSFHRRDHRRHLSLARSRVIFVKLCLESSLPNQFVCFLWGHEADKDLQLLEHGCCLLAKESKWLWRHIDNHPFSFLRSYSENNLWVHLDFWDSPNKHEICENLRFPCDIFHHQTETHQCWSILLQSVWCQYLSPWNTEFHHLSLGWNKTPLQTQGTKCQPFQQSSSVLAFAANSRT